VPFSFGQVYIFPILASTALLPSVEEIAPYTKLANALIFFPIAIVVAASGHQLGAHGIGQGLVSAKPDTASLAYATAVFG